MEINARRSDSMLLESLRAATVRKRCVCEHDCLANRVAFRSDEYPTLRYGLGLPTS